MEFFLEIKAALSAANSFQEIVEMKTDFPIMGKWSKSIHSKLSHSLLFAENFGKGEYSWNFLFSSSTSFIIVFLMSTNIFHRQNCNRF